MITRKDITEIRLEHHWYHEVRLKASALSVILCRCITTEHHRHHVCVVSHSINL